MMDDIRVPFPIASFFTSLLPDSRYDMTTFIYNFSTFFFLHHLNRLWIYFFVTIIYVVTIITILPTFNSIQHIWPIRDFSPMLLLFPYIPLLHYYCRYIHDILTQQVQRNFFSNFGLNLQHISPLDPGYEIRKNKNSVSTGSMIFDTTRFVHLVLTGVRVANFLNIAKFDLIFLHNTHILPVCLFFGLFVIFSVCPVCLSVCMSVLCTVLLVCTVCVNNCLSVHMSVFQPVPVLLHCPSVCLFVCVCLHVFISVCLYV
jgi:hypothetical protein